jgi:two-component system cell cycle sensor histidine kinase/response regulator CckA
MTTDISDSMNNVDNMTSEEIALLEHMVETLKTALESARAGCWEWDVEDNALLVDDHWAAITGHTSDDFDGLTFDRWLRLCHPDESDKVKALIAKYLQEGGELLEIERRVPHKNGEWIQVLDRGKITSRDQNGKPLRLAGSRQALARQDNGNELRDIIDHFPGVFYHIDASGQATVYSRLPAFLKALYSAQEGTTRFDTLSIIHQDDRQMVTDAYRKLSESRQSMTLEYRIIIPDGETRWIEDHIKSGFSDEGLYTGINGIMCDISDRISTQEETRRLEAQLRKSQRLETIGTLAGGIAHDFNNILTPILGYAEMGLADIPADDPMHEYFSEIMLAAERARNLVSQILTFSKAEEGKPTPVSIQEIIEDAIQLLRPSLPSTISIIEHIDKSCRQVLADQAQMHQVIVNLCTNAFHAMEQTGGSITIALREIEASAAMPSPTPPLPDGNYIELTISDTGTGMDDITVERIFEPFFTTKSIEKGAGLGLSVVHGIVTGAGGQLSVESNTGKGSVFHVYWPVIENKVTITPPEKPAKAQFTDRILFVDDEPAAIHMVSMMMTKLGFNIHAEQSPLDALKLFREQPDQFGLVITDLTMPEMTGIQLISELRKISPATPIILMTGYGNILNNDTPLSHYGINRLLKKPVKIAQLAAVVNEVLSSTYHSITP